MSSAHNYYSNTTSSNHESVITIKLTCGWNLQSQPLKHPRQQNRLRQGPVENGISPGSSHALRGSLNHRHRAHPPHHQTTMALDHRPRSNWTDSHQHRYAHWVLLPGILRQPRSQTVHSHQLHTSSCFWTYFHFQLEFSCVCGQSVFLLSRNRHEFASDYCLYIWNCSCWKKSSFFRSIMDNLGRWLLRFLYFRLYISDRQPMENGDVDPISSQHLSSFILLYARPLESALPLGQKGDSLSP